MSNILAPVIFFFGAFGYSDADSPSRRQVTRGIISRDPQYLRQATRDFTTLTCLIDHYIDQTEKSLRI